MLVPLVLALAFLLASTPARNSDCWLHLATGRALVEGQAGFGTEPFTFPESSTYWVNPSWLFDVIGFLLFQSLGGTALVVMKAAAVSVMAAFLILAGRATRGLALPGVAVAIALLAMGPWLSLKPICFSFLFLAWTVWFLTRSANDSTVACPSRFLATSWPILVVFALWANTDSWFFLGPLTIGCFFLGSIITPVKSSAMARTGISCVSWGMLLVASLGVCLLNPHHVHIFEVPVQSTWGADQLKQDASLRAMFLAPFQEVYALEHLFKSCAGPAYWILAVVSFLSFFLAPSSWGLRLTWLIFFLFSRWQTPVVPFFAIVASPILARNFAHYFSRPACSLRVVCSPGRGLALLFLVTLVASAWPGWLQVGPHGPRGWRVDINPAMPPLGEVLAQWQQTSPRFKRVFNFSPETANYLAWVCPHARCFVNSHLHLSRESAADFVALRAGLIGVQTGTPGRWRAVLRDNQASLLVLQTETFTLEHIGAARAMRDLFFTYPLECPPLFLRGGVVAFAWRDPRKPAALPADLLSGMLLDLNRRAFSASDDHSSAPASMTAPIREPRPFFWWDAYWRPRFQLSLDREEGRILLALFDESRQRYHGHNNLVYGHRKVVDLVTAAASSEAKFLSYCLAAAPNPPLMTAVLAGLDDGPIENLYLAVRCFRRALKDNPDDVESHLLLGDTYQRLSKLTRERSWGVVLGSIRQCQMMATYRAAVSLRPDRWQIHDRLGNAFYDIDYKDLAVKHFEEAYHYRAQAGPEPGESPTLFHQRQEAEAERIRKWQKHVQRLNGRFDVNSVNLPVVDRANMAGQLGLAGRALDILLASDIAAFGHRGLETELKLLLNTGQAATVKSWLGKEHRAVLGYTHYHLLRAQAEAALGNYDEARQALQQMVRVPALEPATFPPRDLAAIVVGHVLLSETGGGALRFFPAPTFRLFPSVKFLPAQLDFVQATLRAEAESLVLQGILALEVGNNRQARALFRRAALFWDSPAGAGASHTRSRIARQQARFFLHLLEKANS